MHEWTPARPIIPAGVRGSPLINAIRTFIDGWNDRWNDRCHPFTRTKTADEILEHAQPKKRKATLFTLH
jgi:hypothetical protein